MGRTGRKGQRAVVYSKKGFEMTESLKRHKQLEEAKYWFSGFYDCTERRGHY
jgi:hypothetical protein